MESNFQGADVKNTGSLETGIPFPFLITGLSLRWDMAGLGQDIRFPVV